MFHWVFVATEYSDYNTGTIREILKKLVDEKRWKIGLKTPNRSKLRPGDKILFYASGEGKKEFVASGELDSEFLSNDNRIYGHVELKNILIFEKTVRIKPILDKFSSFKNNRYWGLFFQGGVRKISQKEYNLVIRMNRSHP